MADSLFTELKRRNVFKVGVAYLAGSWLTVEVGGTLLSTFALDESIMQLVVIILAIGLIPVLIFSWVFEITPEGIKKESEITPEDSVIAHTGQKLNYIVTGLMAVALGYFIYKDYFIVKSVDVKAVSAASSKRTIHHQITHTGKSYSAEVSPDGQFIAYTNIIKNDLSSNIYVLYIQDLKGGKPLEIYRDDNDVINNYRWTPDSSKLIVMTVNHANNIAKFFLVPRMGGNIRSIKSKAFFTFSADGRHYASTNQGSNIISITNVSTQEATEITFENANLFQLDLDWSKDGKYLALLTTSTNGKFIIWTIPVEGGKQNKVFETTSKISKIRWSKSSTIYNMQHEHNLSSIWKLTIDPDTGKVFGDTMSIIEGLTTDGTFSLSIADNSLFYGKNQTYSNLWSISQATKGDNTSTVTKQLTFGTFIDTQPQISPDSQSIAFVRSGDIYIKPFGGGTETQLTFMGSSESNPAWSPNSRWIAFGSDAGETLHVWQVNVDDKMSSVFNNTNLSPSRIIKWSPSDNILYHRPGNRNFHFLDPNTKEEKPLLQDDKIGWIFIPVYSNDKTKLAVFWNRKMEINKGEGARSENGRGIWILSLLDNSEIFIQKGSYFPLGWSPDDKSIYAIHSGDNDIVEISLLEGNIEKHIKWPFSETTTGVCSMTHISTLFLCSVRNTSNDIWQIKNFDPNP